MLADTSQTPSVGIGERRRVTVVVILFATGLAGMRIVFPERPMDYVGPRALLDSAFALSLLALMLLLAAGLGLKVLRWLKLDDLTPLEKGVFALPLGLGIIAYGVLTLGLVGLLRPWAILGWLVLAAAWSRREWADTASRTRKVCVALLAAWRPLAPGERSLLVLSGILLIFSLAQALVPPWEYDARMYHLSAPQLFLANGAVSPSVDNWAASYPLTVELLYAIGLAFGSDVFAKLTHLSYAAVLVCATFEYASRLVGVRQAWLALGVLLGTVLLPTWASWAYNDMAWATYEILSVMAISRAIKGRCPRWCALAGMFAGLAAGSKYLALGSAAILGIWFLWQARERLRPDALLGALSFLATTVAVAAPWYLRNLVWSGNPVYPLVLGGPGWDAAAVALFASYQQYGFGMGRGLTDFLLLPWNLYANHERFGTVLAGLEVPSVLLVLCLAYPLVRKRNREDATAGFAALRFALWAAGPQQIRFLLPVMPLLAILSAQCLSWLGDCIGRPEARRVLVGTLVGSAVTFTLIVQVSLCAVISAPLVTLGIESKDAFLRAHLPGYAVLQYIQRFLPADSRVITLWYEAGYYCDSRCLGDQDRFRWTQMVSSASSTDELLRELGAQGITHVLFSGGGAQWFMSHDPTGEQTRAMLAFGERIGPSCTRALFEQRDLTLYELTCLSNAKP